jgi:hypothetical protein
VNAAKVAFQSRVFIALSNSERSDLNWFRVTFAPFFHAPTLLSTEFLQIGCSSTLDRFSFDQILNTIRKSLPNSTHDNQRGLSRQPPLSQLS